MMSLHKYLSWLSKLVKEVERSQLLLEKTEEPQISSAQIFFQVFFFIYLTYPYFNHEKTVQLSHHLVMIISWPGKTKILKNVG